MKKYLLSTGRSTDRVEYYILDLFKLYLSLFPDDIPGANGIGFNFSLHGVMKNELEAEVKSRILNLVELVSGRFGTAVVVSIESVSMPSEREINLVLNVNNISDTIKINL